MDNHRHGYDQYQGDEIRGDDGHLPANQSQHTDHHQYREKTGAKRQYHPAELPENYVQHGDHENHNTAAKYDQVTLNKGDHVIGYHRHAAEIQGSGILD